MSTNFHTLGMSLKFVLCQLTPANHTYNEVSTNLLTGWQTYNWRDWGSLEVAGGSYLVMQILCMPIVSKRHIAKKAKQLLYNCVG